MGSVFVNSVRTNLPDWENPRTDHRLRPLTPAGFISRITVQRAAQHSNSPLVICCPLTGGRTEGLFAATIKTAKNELPRIYRQYESPK